MMVILILVGILAGVGALLYLHHRLTEDDDASVESVLADSDGESGECCGMHITCERDSLLASVSDKIEYFDDEELDRFAGREADGYSPSEADEFRDVLLTLRPDEIAPWARSMQLRGVTLPGPVREELLMIVAEARAAVEKTKEYV